MALFRPQRPLRLLSLPRAPVIRTYAAPARPSTAPKPVRQAVVPKPTSSKAGPPPTSPVAPARTSNSPNTQRAPLAQKDGAKAPATKPKPKPLDPNSPEYKKKYREVARRWLASLVALPIFFVTSYYLFDRIILGNEKKDLPKEGGLKDERDPLAKTL